MKKGIEWLKEEIGDLPITDTVFISDGLSYIDSAVSVTSVYDLIYHLEEPEVLSQEWIRDNQERKGVHFFVNVTKLQNLVVSKKELPVIPKYVADWWERDDDSVTLYGGLQVKKKHKFGLISKFHDKGLGDYLSRVEDWLDENDSAFLDLVNGKPYEVEEEPMYYALIKGHELADGYDIYWNCDKSNCGVFVSRLHPPHDNFITEMSKEAWNELGIDDTNADFVKVEE